MIRHVCVLLLSSVVAVAQAPTQNQTSPAQNQPSTQEQTGQAAPAQQAQPSSDRPFYDYDGKPRLAPLTQPAVAGPDAITVPAGTKIPLSLESPISTKSARP